MERTANYQDIDRDPDRVESESSRTVSFRSLSCLAGRLRVRLTDRRQIRREKVRYSRRLTSRRLPRLAVQSRLGKITKHVFLGFMPPTI